MTLTRDSACATLHAVDEIRRQWGRNIKLWRLWNEFEHQEDLARELGVTKQAVSLWEKGRAVPRDEMKVKLARVLNCEVTQLFPLPKGVAA